MLGLEWVFHEYLCLPNLFLSFSYQNRRNKEWRRCPGRLILWSGLRRNCFVVCGHGKNCDDLQLSMYSAAGVYTGELCLVQGNGLLKGTGEPPLQHVHFVAKVGKRAQLNSHLGWPVTTHKTGAGHVACVSPVCTPLIWQLQYLSPRVVVGIKR